MSRKSANTCNLTYGHYQESRVEGKGGIENTGEKWGDLSLTFRMIEQRQENVTMIDRNSLKLTLRSIAPSWSSLPPVPVCGEG
jgi:hypothetical protein